MSAALSMRTVDRVSASFSFMALVISTWMRSVMLGSVMGSSKVPRAGGPRPRPEGRGRSAAAHRRHDRDLGVFGHGGGEAAGEADALHPDEELDVLAHLARLGEHAIAHRGHLAP